MMVLNYWQVGSRGCSLEEENEADHKEQQDDDNLQEEGGQNSILIIGVGVRVRPGLRSQSHICAMLFTIQCCPHDCSKTMSSSASFNQWPRSRMTPSGTFNQRPYHVDVSESDEACHNKGSGDGLQ